MTVMRSLFFGLLVSTTGLVSLGFSQDIKDVNQDTLKKKIAPKKLQKPSMKNKQEEAQKDLKQKKQEKKQDLKKSLKNKKGNKESSTDTASIERSAISLKLNDRLQIGSSLGFGTISSNEGDWSTSGTGDLSIAFDLNTHIHEKAQTFLSLRYHPIDVVANKDNSAHRGIVEGFHIGSMVSWVVNQKMSAVGSLELGFMKVAIKPILSGQFDEDLNTSGANATLGLGVDWKLIEKLRIGPRLYIGAGKFTTIQFSSNIALLF